MSVAIAKSLLNGTRRVLPSADTSQLNPADWFILRRSAQNAIAQAKALAGNVPPRYWVVDDSDADPANWTVTEGDQAVKDAVDGAEAATDRQRLRARLKAQTRAYLENAFPQDDVFYYLEIYAISEGKPNRRALIQSVWTWKESVLDAVITKFNEYGSAQFPIRVVPLDFSAFDASKPNVNLKKVIEEQT